MVKENYRCKENYWGLVVRQSGARPVIFCVSKKLSEKLRTMNRALLGRAVKSHDLVNDLDQG